MTVIGFKKDMPVELKYTCFDHKNLPISLLATFVLCTAYHSLAQLVRVISSINLNIFVGLCTIDHTQVEKKVLC